MASRFRTWYERPGNDVWLRYLGAGLADGELNFGAALQSANDARIYEQERLAEEERRRLAEEYERERRERERVLFNQRMKEWRQGQSDRKRQLSAQEAAAAAEQERIAREQAYSREILGDIQDPARRRFLEALPYDERVEEYGSVLHGREEEAEATAQRAARERAIANLPAPQRQRLMLMLDAPEGTWASAVRMVTEPERSRSGGDPDLRRREDAYDRRTAAEKAKLAAMKSAGYAPEEVDAQAQRYMDTLDQPLYSWGEQQRLVQQHLPETAPPVPPGAAADDSQARAAVQQILSSLPPERAAGAGPWIQSQVAAGVPWVEILRQIQAGL